MSSPKGAHSDFQPILIQFAICVWNNMSFSEHDGIIDMIIINGNIKNIQ